ncbi:hypothetical protein PENTCL1PPCAC_4895 [Pristionchus entomophagus]|uniref:Neurotransmitter-gated ion-channel ligand-binding domain-containing protein n=1 Tax=Pristionchus entomophagus TaxID=358040 RepID=A0AAV5SJQ0_9BILA|nr:hypothetical protein PENTCL1PPCAC_4895 [Pristionchus entomophagus]
MALALFLVAAAAAAVANAAVYDPDCKWRLNVTDVDDIAHHKYSVLEDCLFYKLSKEADVMQGKPNSLMLLPPTVAAGETLEVDVQKVVVRQMWMSEVFKEMHINGYVGLSWKDRRLRWDQIDWKTDTLNIKSFGRLWVPDINSEKFQTSAQSVDYTNYQNIEARMTGNVTARLEFRMQAQCEIDYSDYPNDRKHCCFKLRSSLYKRYIKFFILSGEGECEGLDVEQIRTNWHIENSWVKKLAADDDMKAEELEICVTARRKSTTLSIELTIPVLISALLILLAPFFGKFQQQINVKMFSILLQFMCFQFLANKTPQVGFGESVPKIYIFYAFTLGVSVVSLIATVIVSAAARVVRKVPPAHRYTLLASVLNANVCCGFEEAPVTDGTSSKDASADWLQIHVALNNLMSFCAVIVYVIGAIVIAF